MKDNYIRKIVEVLKVHDGDTVRVRLDLGFETYRDVWVRLDGIDAPEITGPTKEAGILSKEHLRRLLSQMLDKAHLLSSNYFSFNRCVGKIGWETDAGSQDLGDIMVADGYAEPRTKKEFSLAELI